MRALDLDTIVTTTQAQVLSNKENHFTGIGTDTRVDLSGQLFIALKGEAFDAHQFLDVAISKGAAGVLIHDRTLITDELKSKVTIILVEDTLKALQQLGNWARHQTRAKVVGITGSNGKTTTKEFAAAIVSSCMSVHYNKGSFNNHWGVPFTLLQLPVDKDVALVEMGMNHAGELTELSHIVEPDVVVCTMVGRAHMEFFGTIEKVAEAKEEIYLAAPPKAHLVFNIDNPQTLKMYEKAKRGRAANSLFTFSKQDSTATVQLKIKKATLDTLVLEGVIAGVAGEAEVAVFGVQNLTNIMAAATIGIAVGMTADQVWAALPRCRTIWGRNQILDTKSGAKVIFDAYNANPDSMKALIDNMQLVSIKGKKIGVFGQMREMGSLSPELHRELGQWVGAAGFSDVFFIGSDHEAFQEGVQTAGFKGGLHIESDFNEKIGSELSACLSNNDLVAMKASRGTKLERFVPYAGVIDFQSK